MNKREQHIHVPKSIGAKVADSVTNFFGTWLCLGLHTVWFTLWFFFALDVALLTNIVSLEAIGLAILIMMSQSRASQKDRVRDDLEANEVSEILNNHQELLHLNRTQLKINETQLKILNQQTDILHLLQEREKRR